MNLNNIISKFGSLSSIKKEDLSDITKKNDLAVKTIKNIFDTNLDGKLDNSELAIIDKLSNLDGNNSNGISMTDLKLLAAMNGSVGDISFGDLSILKNGKYAAENNTINTFDSRNNKTSSTTINNDGSVTTTAYAYDKTQTIIEYTSDYKMKSKTVIKKDTSDGSTTTSLYNSDGKPSLVTKTDSNNKFLSKDEYDYDDNGKTASITSYNSDASDAKVTAKTLYADDGTKVQVKYDDNEEIIQRNTFNKLSKPTTSFIKNADGSTVSTTYDYPSNGDVKTTTITSNADGSQQPEQTSTKHSNGNQEVYIGGVLTSKDEVNSDGSIKTTAYSAKDVIDTVTNKDAKGKITGVNYYSYVDGNIDTIIKKDAKGVLTETVRNSYDKSVTPNKLTSSEDYDANNILVAKIIYTDETKTLYKYKNGQTEPSLTEIYGKDDKIKSSVSKAVDGSTVNSTYIYDLPKVGDTSVSSINKNSNGVITTLQDSITHKDGTSENNLYNSDKKLIEKDTADKYGSMTKTLYDNNKITSVTKTNSGGKVTGIDNYNYTNGILASIAHLNASNKSTGTTQYDSLGNSKDYDSLGRLTATKTTDKTTGVVTTEAYQYLSTGDKVIKTSIMLNEKTQSLITKMIHSDKSSETSTFSGAYLNLSQKDIVSSDGKTKTSIYDPATKRLERVINKDVSGNVTLRNEYSYTAKGTVDFINCYNANDKLVQSIKSTADGGKIITNYENYPNIKDVTTYDKAGNVISMP